ncbi:MAG: signal peptidase I [Clostridia bacterium]|nr:signal peptidase I [Clostridia bacterium]
MQKEDTYTTEDQPNPQAAGKEDLKSMALEDLASLDSIISGSMYADIAEPMEEPASSAPDEVHVLAEPEEKEAPEAKEPATEDSADKVAAAEAAPAEDSVQAEPAVDARTESECAETEPLAENPAAPEDMGTKFRADPPAAPEDMGAELQTPAAETEDAEAPETAAAATAEAEGEIPEDADSETEDAIAVPHAEILAQTEDTAAPETAAAEREAPEDAGAETGPSAKQAAEIPAEEENEPAVQEKKPAVFDNNVRTLPTGEDLAAYGDSIDSNGPGTIVITSPEIRAREKRQSGLDPFAEYPEMKDIPGDLEDELIGGTAKKKKKVSAGAVVLDIVLAIVVVLVVFIIVFSVVFRGVYIVGTSMMPTFTGAEDSDTEGGDYVYANIYRNPTYGDVVIVQETAEKVIIKRVIAMGGDSVKMEQGTVYVQYAGTDSYVALEEDYVDPANNSPTASINTFESRAVPEGCYFCLGDNRNVSNDSRQNGAFPKDEIIGVVPAWIISIKGFTTSLYNLFHF